MDGGSTDGTAAILARLAAEAPLRYHVEPDQGQADALNRGFGRASGDIYGWLNADDLYAGPDTVSEAVEVLSDPGVDVVTAGGVYVDADGAVTGEIPPPQDVVRNLRYYDPVLQPATFWKKRSHRPLRTDLHFAFDWQLFLDIAAAGGRFVTLDRRWAAYRWHQVNKSAADPAERRREIAAMLRAQCGPVSIQHIWAQCVYAGYLASELLHVRPLKTATALANEGMRKLTRWRVWSC